MGSIENHSYIRYVGFSKSKAIDEGNKEYEYRGSGMKYPFIVTESSPEEIKTIKEVYYSPNMER